METIKTLVLYKDLCSLLSQKKLKQGLELLFQMVEATSSGELTNELTLSFRVQIYAELYNGGKWPRKGQCVHKTYEINI